MGDEVGPTSSDAVQPLVALASEAVALKEALVSRAALTLQPQAWPLEVRAEEL